MPVHEEPHHREVFQHGTTRILDLRVPPGDLSWFHSHDWPVLYMTLGTSRVRTQQARLRSLEVVVGIAATGQMESVCAPSARGLERTFG